MQYQLLYSNFTTVIVIVGKPILLTKEAVAAGILIAILIKARLQQVDFVKEREVCWRYFIMASITVDTAEEYVPRKFTTIARVDMAIPLSNNITTTAAVVVVAAVIDNSKHNIANSTAAAGNSELIIIHFAEKCTDYCCLLYCMRMATVDFDIAIEQEQPQMQ